jgi:hypothetical protein
MDGFRVDDFKDAVGRVSIGFIGIAWFALSNLNLELGMRDLHFSAREWLYVLQMFAGLLLVVLSCLPQVLLDIRPIRWAFVPIIALVECSVAWIVYLNLDRAYRIHHALQAGTEMLPERAATKVTELVAVATVAAGIAIALALSTTGLLTRRKKALQR